MFFIKGNHSKPSSLRKPEGEIKYRYLGLDALRGIAIIGMVFSGVFPHEAPWPGYMFHAQVGPPDFLYNPEVPGITWVDLVFPFFLFAMGVAFPLSLRRKVEEDHPLLTLWAIVKRGLLLLVFAIAIRNLNWFGLQASGWVNQLTSLVTFGSFFMLFMRFRSTRKEWLLKLGAIGLMTIMVIYHHFFTDFHFDKGRNDIIIVVLANMAVFGSVIWWLTRNNIMLRMGIIAFFLAIWFTHDVQGSWTKYIWDFHPSAGWMYHFSYLKYLCIVLPGSVLGDLLLRSNSRSGGSVKMNFAKWGLTLISFLIILTNLYGLYVREVLMNLFFTGGLIVAGKLWLYKFREGFPSLYFQIFNWATFFILLGLFMEPMDGGIKKDPSSLSYWFLTSGLAFIGFIICQTISEAHSRNFVWKPLIRSGQNPMVAYVAIGFLISPLFALTSISELFIGLRETSVYLGLVKTVVMTLLVVMVTTYTVKKKWFWKT